MCCVAPPLPHAPGCCVQDYTTQVLDQYVISANVAPVAFNVFTTLPLDANYTMILNTALHQMAEMKALVLLTVEPADGLSAVTYDAIGVLAGYIKQAQLVISLNALPCAPKLELRLFPCCLWSCLPPLSRQSGLANCQCVAN